MQISPASPALAPGGAATPLNLSFFNENNATTSGSGGASSAAPLPASAFRVEHGALLHFIALGSDFSTLIHVHPGEATPGVAGGGAGAAASSSSNGSTFQLEIPLANPGDYVVLANAELAGASAGEGEASKQAVLTVTPAASGSSSTNASGGESNALVPVTSWPGPFAGAVNAYAARVAGVPFGPGAQVGRLNLTALTSAAGGGGEVFLVRLSGLPDGGPPKAGERYTLTLRVTTGAGEPVRTLSPFLGAAAHLVLARQDFSLIQHGHATAVVNASSSNASVAAAPAPAAGMSMPMPGGAAAASSPTSGGGAAAPAGMAMSSPPPAAFGPEVTADVTFPAAGFFRLVAEMLVANSTLLAPAFTLLVAAAA